MKLIIKIGSNVLRNSEGGWDEEAVAQLVHQICVLQGEGHQCVLVSSGAVFVGRMTTMGFGGGTFCRQGYASLGQAVLMGRFVEVFHRYQRNCGQILVTKQQVHGGERNGLCLLLEEMLCFGVIPVINENDAVASAEEGFTDNDELAGQLAQLLGADHVCILSTVEGVYRNRTTKEIIRVLHHVDDALDFVQDGTSSHGRGGMQTKLRVAQQMADLGIETTIAHGKQRDVLLDIVSGKAVGTRICAAVASTL